MFVTSRQVKVTLFIALVALFICVVGLYTVNAAHQAGRTDDVEWSFGVNDVRALPWFLQTNSYHYYQFESLTNRNFSGSWEFSHRVREGWNLGIGPVVIDISIHGPVKSAHNAHDTDSKSGYRKASYAGLMPGDYHIDAYTLLDLSVTGKGQAVNRRAKERNTFRWGGGGPN